MVQALEAHGHQVDWRRVKPGDDLSVYDAAWINLAPLNSLNGRSGAMGALWTLSSGLPSVGFFDDWAFSTVFNGARALVKKPQMLTKYLLVGQAHRGGEEATYYDRQEAYDAYARAVAAKPEAEKKMYVERYFLYDTDENVLPHAERLLAASKSMVGARWDAGMVPVCPMYAWGNRTSVRKRMPMIKRPIEALDPSSTIYEMIGRHEPLPPIEKKRTWILGALMPHDAWVDRREWGWPIEYLGSRKMITKRGGERVKTEDDVIDRYNQHWGILSPPYPHAGCGWWRSRFMYSARVRSVLACDKGEGDAIGPSYRLRPAQIEQLDDDGLVNLAEEQADQLRPYMPPPGQFVEHVNAIVARALREDTGGYR